MGVTVRDARRDDYSTADNGIVPFTQRRPMWHFIGLWISFSAGVANMLLGIELYDGGFSLVSTCCVAALGYALYAAYAIPAAYLGARTGQTHTLLTRSIFGRVGSCCVSLLVVLAPLGWVGVQAGLLADVWAGLYHVDHPMALTLLLAAAMIAANLFGFTGISAYARYLVAPLLIAWGVTVLVQLLTVEKLHVRASVAAGARLPFWVAVASAIGFAMWGNEPDIWRYGRPKILWPAPTFFLAGTCFGLFVCAGWLIREASQADTIGGAMRFAVDRSFFGAASAGLLVAAVSGFAINDGNYYEAINACQNLVGDIRWWRRTYTVIVVGALGVAAAYVVVFHFVNGWYEAASFLAITVPSATTIMVVDQYVLPLIVNFQRPIRAVPSWSESGGLNVPAVLALLASVAFGMTGTAGWPGGLIYSTPPTNWGPVPLETWLLAAASYMAFAKVAAVVSGRPRRLLGFVSDA
jgi:purine-cytosine permease-like protein